MFAFGHVDYLYFSSLSLSLDQLVLCDEFAISSMEESITLFK